MKSISVSRTVAILLLFPLCLASCAPKQTEYVSQRILKILGSRPPIDEDLATLAPAGLQGAAWINLDSMRHSPLWPTLESVLETHYASDLFPRETVLYILRHADEILAVSGHRNEHEADGFVTLMKGSWDTAEVLNRLTATGEFKSTASETGNMLARSNIRIFAVTAKTLAVVSDNLLDKVIELIAQNGRSLREDNHFDQLKLPDNGGSIARYVRGNSSLNTQSFSALPLVYRKFAKNAEGADIAFRISHAIAVKGNITMSSEKQASQLKKSVDRELKTLSSNVLIAMLGVKSLFNKLKLSTQANRVKLSMGLTQKDVNKLLQLVDPLMQLKEML
ncbi:MAG: hypothetical protein JXX14_12640 [Deltaproteobacteria bacterium]|nr:hypothetical protein [Deltaproteobacteria bacterium]